MTSDRDDERTTYDKAKRAYRIASNANRARRIWNWLGIGKASVGNTIAAVGAASVVATGGGMLLYDTVDSRTRAVDAMTISRSAKVAAAQSARIDRSTHVFSIIGFDKAGRRAAFDVLVLAKEYAWVRGSTREIAKAGRTLGETDVVGELFSAPVRAALGNAEELIAVGIASQEGDQATEQQRAADRAARTAEWLSAAVGTRRPISILNLGRYREPCQACETADTSWQRPFVVIAVRDREPQVVTGDALADALEGRANLPSPDRYSRFVLTRVR